MTLGMHFMHAYPTARKTFWMAEARDRARELGMEEPSEGFLSQLAMSLETASRASQEGRQ